MIVAFIVAVAADAIETGHHKNAVTCTTAALHSSNIPLDEVLGLTVSVREPDTLRLVYVREFEPPCASFIGKSVMGAIQLTDGRSFQEHRNGGGYVVRDADIFEDEYDRRTATERSLPKAGGTALLSSARVNTRRVGADFVGVWHVGGKWLVQSFSQLEDRSFTEPRTVLTSSLPVRSVMYFPAPDTQSGRLEVVQEQPNGRARTLAFEWWHGSAFSPR